MKFDLFFVGGCLSFFAAVMHIAIIFGGAEWYRVFGAGEAMATMAEAGALKPTIITLGIATVLAIWGCYAFSAAGLLPVLPLLKLALVLITAVYLIRGFVGLIAPFITQHPAVTQNSVTFWLISSIICLSFGLVHLFALLKNWQSL